MAKLYEDFLNDEGFELTKQNVSSDDERILFLTGSRDDVAANIILASNEGSLALSWEPKN